MDSITHIALGACIGEAMLGKKLGKKAMLIGAVAQSFPDIDFVSSFWMDTTSALLAHRGLTHSFLFCALLTLFLAYLFSRGSSVRLKTWILFFGVQLFLHIFIDAFNNYGTGWFEPFSHYRISFNTIYVADPFFTIWPLMGLIALMLLKQKSLKRKHWWRLGLVFSAVYLLYCGMNKLKIDHQARRIMQEQNLTHTRYFTTPTPLNNWLWYVVAGNDSGYYVGFRSVFDSNPEMHFEYFPRNEFLLDSIRNRQDVQQLIRFSKQFYTVENRDGGLVFNDLRFGQVLGWQYPRERFVFHYFLQQPGQNKLVVQRGRFEKWNWAAIKAMFKRIRGSQPE